VTVLPSLYRHSLALLTDLYQLTMAYAYWKNGLAEREAVFHLSFRHPPFGGQFAIACGLSYAVDFLRGLKFTDDDLDYLASLTVGDGGPLFEPDFLRYLRQLEIRCDVDAVVEGTAVFAGEPLLRVRGPLLQGQIMETPLLNMVNFQTLIATKAARVCRAAAGRPVLEFGLRRAQGIDGGLAASRAAYIGGCDATSNVLAGKLFGIPVKGTHAHSWVMAFGDEREAFQAYAAALPGNCIFLVDTYDSLTGVRNAISVAEQLRREGHELRGIRLDSGDFVSLSREARRLLDEAGFPAAAIVVSGDLDEDRIQLLLQSGACVDVWGVGTRLVTAHDQPALGGVYKLAALRGQDGTWTYRLKLSEHGSKQSDPGILQVRRLRTAAGRFVADVIYDEPSGLSEPLRLVPLGADTGQLPPEHAEQADLLIPIFRAGRCLYSPPSAAEARAFADAQLASCDDSLLAVCDARPYLVGWDTGLFELRSRLFTQTRIEQLAHAGSLDQKN
jgi:nicotinate phosphoribosyltransferase